MATTNTRFILVEDDEETGPIVTGPMGSCCVYDDQETACNVARRKTEEGGTIYVQKLVSVAMFSKPRIN